MMSLAGQFAVAATAATVCRESDGAYINRAFFANWQSQYAVRDAGRERAFKVAISRTRVGVMSQINQQGAYDWCDSYIDSIAGTSAPNNTPVYWDDPLGQFSGPPSQSAVEVWNFFDAD